MGKYIGTAFLLVILIVAAVQFFTLKEQKKQLSSELESKEKDMLLLEEEKQKVLSEIEYFQNKENLEKEFKAKFNYRQPEEKLYILVP